jgi:hypothetical protein
MGKHLWPSKKKVVPFIIFSSIFATFLIIRLFVYLFPFMLVHVKGVHIHHFTYGIIVITLIGFYDLIVRPVGTSLNVISALFGVGIAFIYDEFGMWLKLQDYGVSRYGYDAMIIITFLLINIIYFDNFWQRLAKAALSKVRD